MSAPRHPADGHGPARRPQQERVAAQAEAAREQVAFNFGMFFILMPISAMVAGAIGIITQLVTPLEAAFSAGLVVLVFLPIWFDLRRDGLGERVGTALVGGIAAVAAWLAPVPVLGTVALFLACTFILWGPIVVLAVVAWLS